MFDVTSMDRGASRWEEKLFALSPWELLDGVWFKREDKFAPLGYGGINGSKLRQLIWIFNRNRDYHSRVVSGASVKSPQLSMTSAVAAHYGLPVELVVGATKPTTAIKHLNVQIAARFGAKFNIIKVGYNPALQRAVHDKVDMSTFPVEYGISLVDPTPEELLAFHSVGAAQVQNIPPQVERLIIPAGSCNTLVSVLLGIVKYEIDLPFIFTVGIGPSKLKWVHKRLQVLEKVSGVRLCEHFYLVWPQYQEEAREINTQAHGPTLDRGDARDRVPCMWEHFNIQTSGFSTYHQSMPERYGDIEMHPTYEGKIFRWFKNTEGGLQLESDDNSVGFWIVGSEPQMNVIDKFAPLPQQRTLPLVGE